jgi:hypothetical protein
VCRFYTSKYDVCRLVFRAREEALIENLSSAEAEKGISGFRDTRDNLEHVRKQDKYTLKKINNTLYTKKLKILSFNPSFFTTR